MCDLAGGSVTFTGPFGALLELEHIWETLRTTDELRLRRPELQTYVELDSEYHFDDPAAPAQARLFHQWGRGAPVAERLSSSSLSTTSGSLRVASRRPGSLARPSSWTTRR
jgi:hypothetical protein